MLFRVVISCLTVTACVVRSVKKRGFSVWVSMIASEEGVPDITRLQRGSVLCMTGEKPARVCGVGEEVGGYVSVPCGRRCLIAVCRAEAGYCVAEMGVSRAFFCFILSWSGLFC